MFSGKKIAITSLFIIILFTIVSILSFLLKEDNQNRNNELLKNTFYPLAAITTIHHFQNWYMMNYNDLYDDDFSYLYCNKYDGEKYIGDLDAYMKAFDTYIGKIKNCGFLSCNYIDGMRRDLRLFSTYYYRKEEVDPELPDMSYHDFRNSMLNIARICNKEYKIEKVYKSEYNESILAVIYVDFIEYKVVYELSKYEGKWLIDNIYSLHSE